jgi:hypothetical protein
LRERGWGVPILTRGHTLWYLVVKGIKGKDQQNRNLRGKGTSDTEESWSFRGFLWKLKGSPFISRGIWEKGGESYLKGPVDVKVYGIGLPGSLVDDVKGVDDPGADLWDGSHRRLAHHLPAVQDVLGPHRPAHRHLRRGGFSQKIESANPAQLC